jgi:dTDP-4-amino-4,6-dideoxygalactose transaminase
LSEPLQRLERELREFLGLPQEQDVLFCSSGTVALATVLRGVARCAEKRLVLMSSIVCPQVYFAVIAAGLRPAFITCDPVKQWYGLDLNALEELEAREFVALVWPHLYGAVSQVEQVREICDRKRWLLIEDAALTFGVRYSGMPTGTLGDCAILSFGTGKVIDAGYGGVLLLGDSCSRKLEISSDVILQESRSFNENTCPPGTDATAQYDQFLKQCYNNSYEAFREGAFAREFETRLQPVIAGLSNLDVEKLDTALPAGIFKSADSALARRSEAAERWRRYFADRHAGRASSPVRDILWHPEGTYWRFNVLVEPAARHSILRAGIAARVPISSWYPPLYWTVPSAMIYGSTQHEVMFSDQVLNLWVDGIEDWDRYVDAVDRLFAGRCVPDEVTEMYS